MNFTFDITGDPLCLANIRVCAAVSKLVYDSPNVFGTNGETALVQDCGNCIVVALPGTHDLKDVKEDLDFPLTLGRIKGQPCRVHAGFNSAFSSIYGAINKELLSLPPKPIIGTGHSKGGSVGRRVFLQLIEDNFRFLATATFGEPRGGSDVYAQLASSILGGRSLRITNAADPVPWAPAWIFGNRHSGPEAWMPPGMSRLVYHPTLSLELLDNGLEIYRGWKNFELGVLDEHHIDSYIGRLNALT